MVCSQCHRVPTIYLECSKCIFASCHGQALPSSRCRRLCTTSVSKQWPAEGLANGILPAITKQLYLHLITEETSALIDQRDEVLEGHITRWNGLKVQRPRRSLAETLGPQTDSHESLLLQCFPRFHVQPRSSWVVCDGCELVKSCG